MAAFWEQVFSKFWARRKHHFAVGTGDYLPRDFDRAVCAKSGGQGNRPRGGLRQKNARPQKEKHSLRMQRQETPPIPEEDPSQSDPIVVRGVGIEPSLEHKKPTKKRKREARAPIEDGTVDIPLLENDPYRSARKRLKRRACQSQNQSMYLSGRGCDTFLGRRVGTGAFDPGDSRSGPCTKASAIFRAEPAAFD